MPELASPWTDGKNFTLKYKTINQCIIHAFSKIHKKCTTSPQKLNTIARTNRSIPAHSNTYTKQLSDKITIVAPLIT